MNRELETMIHLWGNPIASVDIETTGTKPGYHEIIQIAIVPMTLDLDIASVKPFYYCIKPEHPENADDQAMRTNGLNLDDLILNAPSRLKVMDYLVEWFYELPLGAERRLTPLAFNWAFEKSFLIDWLGDTLLHTIFTVNPRDPMIFAHCLNDRSGLMGMGAAFNNVSLKGMCDLFGIAPSKSHDALSDAIDTAKLYQQMMRSIIR